MKLKLCPGCTEQVRAMASLGGRSGSREDKVRASRAAAVARAESCLKLTFKGKTMSVSQWAEQRGIPKVTIWRRLRNHLPLEKVLAVHGAEHLPAQV